MNDQSNGQKLFLTRLRRHRITVLISRVLILTVFLFLWELCARFEIIDSFIFSSPSKITLCFLEMLKNRSLFLHIGITLYETFISFILVILLSILAAILLWYSKKLSEILEPYLVVLNSLPKSALAPLLIVWLGATSKTIIIAGMSVAIFGSILNLYTAFINVDQEKIKLIYNSLCHTAHRPISPPSQTKRSPSRSSNSARSFSSKSILFRFSRLNRNH